MLNKALSVITMLAAIVIFFAQPAVTHADSLSVGACTRSHCNFALYVVGAAYGDAENAEGWLCVVNADGGWIDCQVTALDVQTTAGGTVSHLGFFGWYDDCIGGWYELTCTQTGAGTSVSISGGGSSSNVADRERYGGWLYQSK